MSKQRKSTTARYEPELKKASTQMRNTPRRPLQVGDRVSFEGYNNNGVCVSGKGTLQHIGEKFYNTEKLGDVGFVTSDDGAVKTWLGLRSFRRLVKRGGK